MSIPYPSPNARLLALYLFLSIRTQLVYDCLLFPPPPSRIRNRRATAPHPYSNNKHARYDKDNGGVTDRVITSLVIYSFMITWSFGIIGPGDQGERLHRGAAGSAVASAVTFEDTGTEHDRVYRLCAGDHNAVFGTNVNTFGTTFAR